MLNPRVYTGKVICGKQDQQEAPRKMITHWWGADQNTLHLKDAMGVSRVVFVGPATPSLASPILDLPLDPTLYTSKQEFIREVSYLKAHGCKTLVTIHAGPKIVTDQKSLEVFVASCHELVNTYGFDGVNIYLTALQEPTYFIQALYKLLPLEVVLSVEGSVMTQAPFSGVVKTGLPTMVVPLFGNLPVSLEGVIQDLATLSHLIAPEKILIGLCGDQTVPSRLTKEQFVELWDVVVRSHNPKAIKAESIWNLLGVSVQYPHDQDYYKAVSDHVLGNI